MRLPLQNPSPLRIDPPPAPSLDRGVMPLDRKAIPRDTVALARFLLGKIVVRELGEQVLSGRIVETEAYLPSDPACHAFRGMTPRNRSLFLDAGHSYVYLCYGSSYMLNVASETAGIGAGVLVRALEPLLGIEHMQRARRIGTLRDLARGPGRLAAALQVDLKHDGLDLCRRAGLWIGADDTAVEAIGESVRIGLTKGREARLRYFVAGNRYLSGPRGLNGSPLAAHTRNIGGTAA